MNRRPLLQLIAAACLAVASMSAVADNILETRSFVLTLPAGWKTDVYTTPVSASGPRGELLQISATRITGPAGPSQELARIRAEFEAIGIRTLRVAESEPTLEVESPIARVALPSGVILNEVRYRARDSGWKIAQFSVLGPRHAYFVSLRVPPDQVSSIAAVRQSIVNTRWVEQ